MVVELVGPYPVHYGLGVGSNEEVERGRVGTATLIGIGQSPGWNSQGAAIGLGNEAACRVPLETEHCLDLARCQTHFKAPSPSAQVPCQTSIRGIDEMAQRRFYYR